MSRHLLTKAKKTQPAKRHAAPAKTHNAKIAKAAAAKKTLQKKLPKQSPRRPAPVKNNFGFSHAALWLAIDSLAATRGHTASGLARAAGLDATSFNVSKRIAADGKQRWPSTESLAKILTVTNSTLADFAALVMSPTTKTTKGKNPAKPKRR